MHLLIKNNDQELFLYHLRDTATFSLECSAAKGRQVLLSEYTRASNHSQVAEKHPAPRSRQAAGL